MSTNKTQATPGPWRVDDEGRVLGDSNGISSVLIATPPVQGQTWRGITGPTRERLEANARLIAAAPQMRDSLVALVHEIRTGGKPNLQALESLCEDADVALRAANGETGGQDDG